MQAYNAVRNEGMLRNERLISWKSSMRGLVVVNVDGSVFTDSGDAGFGGLI